MPENPTTLVNEENAPATELGGSPAESESGTPPDDGTSAPSEVDGVAAQDSETDRHTD